MPFSRFFVLLFLVSCARPAPSGEEALTPQSFIISTVYFILMGFFVWYMFVLKPGMDKREAHKNFVGSLKRNDEVITTGGIFARVVSVKPEYVLVEVASNIRVKVAPQHLKPKLVERGQADKVDKPDLSKSGRKKK